MVIGTNKKIVGKKLGTSQSQPGGENKAVPKSLGFIRYKIQNGRIYFYWVIHTTNRGRLKQKILAYLGGTLPKGVRIGRVTPQMAKLLKRRGKCK